MTYLSLRNVVKSYDGVANAVDDVSIDVEKGEFVTFLGPSGSGKTTTLMMIAGFEYPTRGAIALDGRDLTLSRPYERNIGMVFQNYALFPHMTVLKNVTFPLRMRGFPKREIDQRAHAMLELVGLGALTHRHPRELSGGQQQRVALARGLVFNPDVLLLDEPLGALDKNLREQMQVEIKRVHREVGITMIYVTHDQTEAMTMSDRIVVFRAGRLEQIGSPLEVYRQPSSRFVGEFIGDSNFFAGTIDPGGATVHLDGLGSAKIARTPLIGAVDVLIRPERLRRVMAGENMDGLNVIKMTVDAIINYGDSILAIGTAAGLPIRVRLSGLEPDAPASGDTITLGWSPADAHLIPRES